ncbi:MAG: hypothetical protein JWR69_3305, partial [Pedosphaera sp.]|nr:hypothetical protein [Pedosphaera sp.]
GELVKKLDEVCAKELALDRTKGNKEKLTILGQHMCGPEFKVERPESELTEEEKQAMWKKQAEDEEAYKKEIYAEQDARNARFLEAQR